MGEDLRNTLIVSKDKTQYDLKAKKILARESILSYILATTVDEFKGMAVDEVAKHIYGKVYVSKVPTGSGLTNYETENANGDRIVVFNTEEFENNEGLARFDILFYVRMKDGISQIIINLEAQKAKPSGYNILNRAVFYVSRLVSSQKERDFVGDNYDDIKRVYTIWLCMNMDSCIWNYFHLTNEAYMGNYDWGGKLDLINIVLLGIPNKLPEKGEEYELHRLLSTLFSVELPPEERIDILQEEYNIAYEDAFRKELIELCNLSEGILEQGEVRGRTKEAKESAQRMYKKGYEIPVIADLLNRTEQQIKIWLGLTLV